MTTKAEALEALIDITSARYFGHRTAAEKIRTFLSSLPDTQEPVACPPEYAHPFFVYDFMPQKIMFKSGRGDDTMALDVLNVRGWGHLTGHGQAGLKIPHEVAALTQDTFGKWVAKVLTEALSNPTEGGAGLRDRQFAELSAKVNWLIGLIDTRKLFADNPGLLKPENVRRLDADIVAAMELVSELATVEGDEDGNLTNETIPALASPPSAAEGVGTGHAKVTGAEVLEWIAVLEGVRSYLLILNPAGFPAVLKSIDQVLLYDAKSLDQEVVAIINATNHLAGSAALDRLRNMYAARPASPVQSEKGESANG